MGAANRPTPAEFTRRLSIVLAVLILIGFWGISAYISAYNNQFIKEPGYFDAPNRQQLLTEISLILTMRSFDSATGVIAVSPHIWESLPPHYTETGVNIMGRNITKYFVLPTPPGQGFGLVINPITNSTQERPFTDVAFGLQQRFPYDQYFLYYSITFGPFENGTFQSGFLPLISFQPILGWHAVVTENSRLSGAFLTVQTNVVLFRDSVNSLQYFIPVVTAYFLLGTSLFIPMSSRREEQSPLVARCATTIALVVLALAMLVLFAPSSNNTTSFSFLQATYISLLLSSIIVLSFSVLNAFTTRERRGEFSTWDFRALVMASVIAVFFEFGYSFLSILPSARYFYQASTFDLLRYGLRTLDYRIPLWFVMVIPVLWIAFFHQEHLSGVSFTAAGIGGLTLILTSEVPQLDIALTSLSVLYTIIGVPLLVSRILTRLRKRTTEGARPI